LQLPLSFYPSLPYSSVPPFAVQKRYISWFKRFAFLVPGVYT